jgi:hypothetical protein
MYRMVVGRVLETLCPKSTTIFGLALLALFMPAAQAQNPNPLNYFQNYFATGDYVVGGVALAGAARTSTSSSVSVSSAITLNTVPCTNGPGLFASVVPCTAKGAVPADIIAAFLYWQTIETTETPSSANGTFNGAGNGFTTISLGNPAIGACEAGSGGVAYPMSTGPYAHVYRADVLTFLPINNTANVRMANATQTFTLTSTSTKTQFIGATLVVVYRLVTPGNPRIAPLRSVVIYDGAFTATSSPSSPLNQTYMGGLYQGATTNPAAHMTQIVGNGQSGFGETLTNTGISSGVSDPFVGALGKNWDNYSYNISLAAGASSVATEVVLNKGCLTWAAIVTSTNVQDSDFDGLLDIWEEYGLYLNPGVRNDGSTNQATTTAATFATCSQYPTTCLDLPAMGASPTVPDIFMQIDWMQGSYGANHVHNPQLAALNMVGAAFKAHGINIHFDVGTNSSTCQAAGSTTIGPCAYQGTGSPYIIPATVKQGGNVIELAQGGNVISESGSLLCPNSQVPLLSTCAFNTQSPEFSVLGWKTGFNALKNGDPLLNPALPQLFALNRKDTFHYAVFGHALGGTSPLSIEESPPNCAASNSCLAASISGVADLPGGDLMVTFGLWRSDIPAVDQVGTELQQAGTLMHELGHNLDLHHGGWNSTPVCMPNYPSVMNYLYQVLGLTDSTGVEHIDYSYGLYLPMSEDLLSSLIPMGIQPYAVRYFGPWNAAIDTPGQKSVAYCNGNLYDGTSAYNAPEGGYVRLQGSSVSTPDWSNGTVLPLGKLITSGLDINYDGTIGQIFTDSPDWLSLNLQQVGARANANGQSLNVGQTDIGQTDIGQTDIGQTDIGQTDIGQTDIGTMALGQDSMGDVDYTSYVLSGGVYPPSGLGATVSTAPISTAGWSSTQYPGATGISFTWTPSSTGQASSYNLYACNATNGACTPAAPALVKNIPGGTATPSYTLPVNNLTQAGTACPSGSVCYNTPYNFFVTEIVTVGGISTETCSPASSSCTANIVSSEVNHLFVTGTIASTSLVYGAESQTSPNTITVNTGGNGTLPILTSPPSSPPTGTLTQAYCVYTGTAGPWSQLSPPTAATPRNVGTYYIFCTGPSVVSTTVGVTYNPSNLTYTPPPPSSTLTINQRPITVTEAASSKVYDGNVTCSVPTCTTAPVLTWAGSGAALAYSDTPNFSESFDNKNVGTSSHTVTPAGTVNDLGTPVGSNYSYTFVPIKTGTITPATLTITATTNTKTYDGTRSAAAIPTTSVVCDGSTITGPPALCGTTDTVANLVETYNTPNAGTGLTLTVSQGYTISDNNGGNNYSVILKTNTTGVINPAPVTATAGGYSGTYSGAAHSPTPACNVTPTTPAVSTFVGTVSCTNNPASVGPNVGTGTVAPVSAVGTNDSLTNYAITPVSGSWTISPAPVTATAGSYSGTYNGASQSPSACTVTPNAPNTYTGSLTCANNPASVGPNVGSGTVTPAPAVGANNSLSNYAITSVNASWKINPAPVTATAGSLNATYNGASQSPSACTVASNNPPSTFVGTVTCLNNPTSVGPNVGSGMVTPAPAVGVTDSLSNYAITPGNGTWIINQATPVVTDNGPPSSPPDYYGQQVMLTATVAPPQSGEIPTGTVTFSFTLNSGATTYYICSGGTISTTQCPVALSLTSPYIASVTTSTLPTAAENVVATYSGDTNFLGEPANDNPVSVTVSQASSAVTLTKSANPTTYGSQVSLTVNVADATNGSIGVPTGTVTLSFVLDPTVQNGQVYYICADGSVITAPCASLNQITLGTDLANPTTVTVPTSALPAGLATFANSTANPKPYSYAINATYSGDTNFAGGSSIGLSQTVNPLPVTVTAGSYSGTYNGSPESPSACIVTATTGTFVGTVTCTNSPTSVGPPAGSGTVNPVPSVGAGDSLNNYAITLAPSNWNIAKASTTTTITSVSPSPTDPTVPATVTVTVVPVAPGTGTPTGSVTVNSSPAGVSCTVTPFSGTGSCPLTFTAGGQQSLTATYTSNSSNLSNSATSAATSLSVNQPVIIGPSSLPPATLNFPYQPQQLTATGGSGSYTNYAVTGGSLPTGLTLSSSGLLSGTPTAAGTNPVTVSVTDSLGDVIPQNYTISTGFTLVGTAAVNGAGVQLTSATSQAGAAWAGTQQSVASGFSASFQFQITPDAAADELADGLAFVIQADTRGASALGGGGGDIGYAGTTTGITNSLAVEFDTYDDSSAPEDDPNGNHIAIISNGTGTNLASHCQTSPGSCSGGSSVLAVTNSSLAFTLADGALHTVTITYTGGSSGTLTVSVGTTTIVTATNLNLETLLGLPSNGTAWVGFTGGSGAGGENGDISNWSFSAGQ